MVGIRASGLFSVFRPRPSDAKSPEHVQRSLLFFGVLVHIDDIKRSLGPKWGPFAEELRIRLEPITLTPPAEISDAMLYNATDEIIHQTKSWPEADEVFEYLKNVSGTIVANVAMRTDWRVKADLLATFHRMYDRLQREGVATESAYLEGMSSSQGFMEVPVWFGTCRQPSGSQSTEAYFGTERADALAMGVARVSIPDTDDVAQMHAALPYMWFHDRLRPVKSKHSVVLMKCIGMDDRILRHHMARYQKHAQQQSHGHGVAAKESCIYVHGFNSKFVNAARKMALCGYKMHVDAPLFMFSWPSFQAVDRYHADEGNAMWAVPHFMDFLTRVLTEFNLEKVHLIGHSMGSRVILYALARLRPDLLPPGAAKLGRLVLAAPDFDLGEFYLMQKDLSKMLEQVNIYSSANDQALHVSKRIHGGHPRLGEFPSSPGTRPWHLPFAPNIDLVDATGLDRSVIGHGYVFSHAGVLRDACEFLRDGIPAESRPTLRPTALPGGFRYYTFQGVSEAPSAIEAEMGDMDESQYDEDGDE